MNRLALLPLALLLALAMTACSDDSSDGGGGGGGVKLDSPSDRKLSDFSEEEIKDACDELDKQTDAALSPQQVHRITCAYAGILFGAFDEEDPVGACQMTYDACIADPDAFLNEEPGEEDDECGLDPVDCDATVGQLEDCADEQIAALRQLANGINCQTALTAGPTELGPACTELMNECPDLFGDGNNGGPNNGGPNNGGPNNGEPEVEFPSHGGGCGGSTFDFDVEVRGEVDRVELTLTLGDATEVHPLTRGEDTEDGLATWAVSFQSTGTFVAGESTAFACGDDYIQSFRAYAADAEVACAGDGC